MSAIVDAADADATVDELLRNRAVVVACDFDGTLAGIVDDPDAAAPVDGAVDALRALAELCPVAVVSGRGLDDVRSRIGLDGIWYAGSHGFELCDSAGVRHDHPDAETGAGHLDAAKNAVDRLVAATPGTSVEHKPYAIAVHHRGVDPDTADELAAAVDAIAADHEGLRISGGRAVIELRPDIDWDKGRALEWIVDQLGADEATRVVFAGDDLTDEDALAVVAVDGLGIVVRHGEHGDRESYAHLAVDSPAALVTLLEQIAQTLRGRGR
jgi:trehalose-phosphatase